MTSQEEFIGRMLEKLDEQSVPYMLSGSVSSSLHGQPRATRDVDIVIAPTQKQLMEFCKSLGEDYYVSLDAASEAFANNSMFNIIDNQSGWKADFILRKDRPFSLKEFERKRIAKIKGLSVCVASPEDTILSKLEWAKDSQSEQQFRDALGVTVVQWQLLDMDYLSYWASQLKIADSLHELLSQAEIVVSKKDKST